MKTLQETRQRLARLLDRFVMRYRQWMHDHTWEYGTCGLKPKDGVARCHMRDGNVQFVLWKTGEQGHSIDYWHDFDSSWWSTFKADA